MRVTQSMLNNQLLRNLRNTNVRLEKYQEMLSGNKRINKPSDDPVGVGAVMRYKAQLERNDQYLRNLDSIQGYLEVADTTISQINDIFHRVRELAVQGASDTTPKDAREKIAKEVDQLLDELVQLGNVKFNGKHIFNGYKTDTPPYSTTSPWADAVDTNKLKLFVSDGVTFEYSINGQDVFGTANPTSSPDSNNAFEILDDLRNKLRATPEDSAGISSLIDTIDSRMTQIQNAWAEVGARANRVELLQNRLKDAEYDITYLRSKVEDADMAETITNLKMVENVHRAALGAGARILQPSLVDFLR
ncbi:flagellar hook-associated protein FlgL [Effusibacillus lacus]|uniref:Flagellar hook-associated protein FlgL n=1 Tax=Effusibacillus lacus TaxID=1348429 RepID=A0A292YIG1_9BACL|nr:flagellar hook-associated protein FlgL [Effusibacillus lacus]TCS69814.1 flagellar hook-associated protein 3 FlgL [Effusibacillus lacus]GAX88896.1 flagellar hook-associated protein FlgL [Effusibacillus lacus]